MNFYEVKIDGKKYDRIPVTLEDVTMRRFLAFRNVPIKHELPLIYWLLEAEPEFKDSQSVENELAGLFSLTDEMIEDIYKFMESNEKNATPKTVRIFNKTINLEKTVFSSLPYWPYVVTKKIIAHAAKKQDGDITDKIPEIVAHYLYKEATGRTYTEKDAEEFTEIILDLPFTVCVQLGNFFLRKQKRSKK